MLLLQLKRSAVRFDNYQIVVIIIMYVHIPNNNKQIIV